VVVTLLKLLEADLLPLCSRVGVLPLRGGLVRPSTCGGAVVGVLGDVGNVVVWARGNTAAAVEVRPPVGEILSPMERRRRLLLLLLLPARGLRSRLLLLVVARPPRTLLDGVSCLES
jgi:hypothetical protein